MEDANPSIELERNQSFSSVEFNSSTVETTAELVSMYERVNEEQKGQLIGFVKEIIEVFKRKDKYNPDIAEILQFCTLPHREICTKIINHLSTQAIDDIKHYDVIIGLAEAVRWVAPNYLEPNNVLTVIKTLSNTIALHHKDNSVTFETHQLFDALISLVDALVDARLRGLNPQSIQKDICSSLKDIASDKEKPELAYRASYVMQGFAQISAEASEHTPLLLRGKHIFSGATHLCIAAGKGQAIGQAAASMGAAGGGGAASLTAGGVFGAVVLSGGVLVPAAGLVVLVLGAVTLSKKALKKTNKETKDVGNTATNLKDFGSELESAWGELKQTFTKTKTKKAEENSDRYLFLRGIQDIIYLCQDDDSILKQLRETYSDWIKPHADWLMAFGVVEAYARLFNQTPHAAIKKEIITLYLDIFKNTLTWGKHEQVREHILSTLLKWASLKPSYIDIHTREAVTKVLKDIQSNKDENGQMLIPDKDKQGKRIVRKMLYNKRSADKKEVEKNIDALKDKQEESRYIRLTPGTRLIKAAQHQQRAINNQNNPQNPRPILPPHTLKTRERPLEEFTGRKKELQKLHEQLQTHNTSVAYQTIAGLGGVGKTQFARKYAWDYQDDYHLIQWLAAETSGTLSDSYGTVAEVLGLETKNIESKTLIRQVNEQLLNHLPALLVFDNAEDYDSIKAYLPPSTPGLHILITSRNQRWGSINTVPLGNFEPEEARDYIRTHLEKAPGRAGEYNDNQANDLAEALYYFPLALSQAMGYIIEHKTSLPKYLELFVAEPTTLLKAKGLSNDEYGQTIYKTFTLTIKSLQEQVSAQVDSNEADKKADARDALILLDICAYLEPDNLYKWLLALWIDGTTPQKTELRLNSALELLSRHSLITQSSDALFEKLSMHRLVQTLLRMRHKETDSARLISQYLGEVVAEKIMGLVDRQDIELCRIIAPHLKIVLSYYNELAPEQQVPVKSATISGNLGIAYETLGKFAEARDIFLSVLPIKIKAYGKEHIRTAFTRGNLAIAYQGLGQFEEARDIFLSILPIMIKAYGEEHIDTALIRENLAIAYGQLGQVEEARDIFLSVLPINIKAYGEEHGSTAMTRQNLAIAYQQLGQVEEARDIFLSVLPIMIKAYGEEHINIAFTRENLADAYQQLGLVEKARDIYLTVLPINIKAYGEEHVNTARAREKLAVAYRKLGQVEEARDIYLSVLPIYIKAYGEEHVSTARTWLNLANVYLKLDQFEEAILTYQEVIEIAKWLHLNGQIDVEYLAEKLRWCLSQLGRNNTETHASSASHGMFSKREAKSDEKGGASASDSPRPK